MVERCVVSSSAASWPADPGFVGTLWHRFQAQVAATPSVIALSSNEVALSYSALAREVDSYRHHLRKMGLSEGQTIAVALDRGVEQIVSILAVLALGSAYLPVSTRDPAARVKKILSSALATAVIGESAVGLGVPNVSAPVIGDAGDVDPAASFAASDDSPAYVLFTSGSTGEPKGVVIPHRAVCERLQWMQDDYDLGPGDRVLLRTPFVFDISVAEVFWPLVTGATLVIADPGADSDPRLLLRQLARDRISVLHLVPTLLSAAAQIGFDSEHCSLEHIFSAGEVLSGSTVRAVFGQLPGVRLHNWYGPTEATVACTTHECDRRVVYEKVPIGRAVAGSHVFVCDESGALLAEDCAGELWIAGAGIAHGYIGDNERTQERFVIRHLPGIGMVRAYRTGDLARIGVDGQIEFLGRLDDQIKLRGYRIELGEIESAIALQPQVVASTVGLVAGSDGTHELVALVEANGRVDTDSLRQRLRQALPEYMLPRHLRQVEHLPRTTSGKIDRKRALHQSMLAAAAEAVLVGPADEVERALCDIWRAVLGHSNAVSVLHDFAQQGGDSLSAFSVLLEIEQRFGIAFQPHEIMRLNIREVAGQIAARAQTATEC